MGATSPNSFGDAANSVGDNLIRDLANDLRELAAPINRSEKMSAALQRAARLAGLAPWRVFNIWYGKARRVEEAERAAVAAALDKKRREAARNELHELRTRLLRLEGLLSQIDPDFHRENLAANRQQLRAMERARGS